MNENTQWAIIEIFGHDRYVGIISDHQIGGESFVRVDIPDTGEKMGFTKLFGKNAIYSITFIDENTGEILIKEMEQEPIKLWRFLDWEAQRLLTTRDNEEDGAP